MQGWGLPVGFNEWDPFLGMVFLVSKNLKEWSDKFAWLLRRVVRNNIFKVQQLLHVFVVEPLDLEVQVHVVCALTQSVLLVVCEHTNVTSITTLSCMMGRIFDNEPRIRNQRFTLVFKVFILGWLKEDHSNNDQWPSPTFHGVLHVESKQSPHDFCWHLPYVQFLRESETETSEFKEPHSGFIENSRAMKRFPHWFSTGV